MSASSTSRAPPTPISFAAANVIALAAAALEPEPRGGAAEYRAFEDGADRLAVLAQAARVGGGGSGGCGASKGAGAGAVRALADALAAPPS